MQTEGKTVRGGAGSIGHLPVDEEWLARRTEPVLEPELPIVDAHHHLFDFSTWSYGPDALAADLATGHRIISTVAVECGASYRTDEPAAFQSVGETAYLASTRAAGRTEIAGAIVSRVDLTRGHEVPTIVERHLEVADGRLRGIRQTVAWDADPAVTRPLRPVPQGLLAGIDFRTGFGHLAELGLSFDVWCYHPQLPEVIDLARAFPDTVIVLDHLGGPLGAGSYALDPAEVHREWLASMTELALCPNVVVKLGGLAMKISGRGYEDLPDPPSSEVLARDWEPWMLPVLDLFGPARCMFESNFPIEKGSLGYVEFWNACKRLTTGFSDAERRDLFRATAERVYRIGDAGAGADIPEG